LKKDRTSAREAADRSGVSHMINAEMY